MNWIILSCNYGRLGNRLHTHANLLAWCISNDYNLSNLSFRSYSNLFDTQRHHSSDSYFKTKNIVFCLAKLNIIIKLIERLILSKKWIGRLSLFFYHIEKDHLSTLDEHELDAIKTNKIIIINAWDIRCPKALMMFGQTVKNLLQPASCYMQKASNFVTHLKKSYNYLVGIHARRGDYKSYLGGKHFHSWESYLNWIMEVKHILEKKGYDRIGFVLCSDDSPPPQILNNSFIHFNGTNHFMIDLHTLTLCDYNIGPPSSFGTWISWYGNVLRLIIDKDTKIENLANFSISNSC